MLEAEHDGEDPGAITGAAWDHELRAWRLPAERHAALTEQLAAADVRISDELRDRRASLAWSLPELRWYQEAALDALAGGGLARRDRAADRRGQDAGRDRGDRAARRGRARAWCRPASCSISGRARCRRAARSAIGRLGDGDHVVAPVTVATYASAVTWAPRIGDRFGLVIVDEAHHVGAWCPAEIFEMLVAPARLGLTATPPDDAGALARHVGPVVYARSVADLVGRRARRLRDR